MPPTVKAIVAKDIWTLSEGTHNNKPLIIRFREQFQAKPDVSGYPKRLMVTWTYDGGPFGMPDTEASDKMRKFEDRLIAAVETDLNAVLTAVITNDNKRTWVYYASSTATFGERLTKMPQEEKRYPITIEASDDKDWNYLHQEILAGLKEKKE